MPPRVVVSIPKSLQTTADERLKLKSAFKSRIKSIVKGGEDNPVTNVGKVVTEVIVVNGQARKRAAKSKAGKKK